MDWKDIIKGLTREEKDATREFVQDEVKEGKRFKTATYMKLRYRLGRSPTNTEIRVEMNQPSTISDFHSRRNLIGKVPPLPTQSHNERKNRKAVRIRRNTKIGELVITYGIWAQQNNIPIEHLENFMATEEGRNLTNKELKDIERWKIQQGL